MIRFIAQLACQEAGGAQIETGERYAFSSWKPNHYFEFVSAKGNNIRV